MVGEVVCGACHCPELLQKGVGVGRGEALEYFVLASEEISLLADPHAGPTGQLRHEGGVQRLRERLRGSCLGGAGERAEDEGDVPQLGVLDGVERRRLAGRVVPRLDDRLVRGSRRLWLFFC